MQKKSLSGLFPKNKNPSTITYNDIVRIIENSKTQSVLLTSMGGSGGGGGDNDDDNESRGQDNSHVLVKGMVRKLTDDISIRNGKYGDYIFYKRPDMKNPTFFKIKGFKDNYKTCSLDIIIDWIKLTYKI